MRKMRRGTPFPGGSRKALYQDLGDITNHHKIEWLETTFFGLTSHSSVHLPDSAQLPLLVSYTAAIRCWLESAEGSTETGIQVTSSLPQLGAAQRGTALCSQPAWASSEHCGLRMVNH